jgi:hypothetical protein
MYTERAVASDNPQYGVKTLQVESKGKTSIRRRKDFYTGICVNMINHKDSKGEEEGKENLSVSAL